MPTDRDWAIYFSIMDGFEEALAEREEELAAEEARQDLLLESYLEERQSYV